MSQGILVQKYGGVSVATPELIKDAAKCVASLAKNHRIIVVISAMGKSTDDLTRLAYQVSARPNRRELDMLLTTGERVSAALLSMALNDLNSPSISFTGSQAGVMTSGPHSDASIDIVKPIRVEESLNQGKIVVLAGYQGVDPVTKEITTLGRGGTDTTAVAFATHFKAIDCQIMKEVDGLFTADPRLVAEARLIRELDYDSMLEMCEAGAKLLHGKSVEFARRHGTPISIGRAQTQSIGTHILPRDRIQNLKIGQPLAVNCLDRVEHVAVKASDVSAGLVRLQQLLNKYNLPMPRIWASAHENGEARFMLSCHWEVLDAILGCLKLDSSFRSLNKTLAAVSITCFEKVSSEQVARFSAELEKAKISAEKILPSGHSVTFFVRSEHMETTARALHRII